MHKLFELYIEIERIWQEGRGSKLININKIFKVEKYLLNVKFSPTGTHMLGVNFF